MRARIELSEKQRKIVFAENRAICVKASAGSGKTRVMTERVRYLLGKTRKKVLALTFTNKAGEEIRERLNDIPEAEKRIFVGTFHGFCQSVLENHGRLIGLAKMPHLFEDEADRLELIEQAIHQTPSYASKYKRQDKKQQENSRYRTLNFISKVKRELIADSEFEHYDENLVLLYQNCQDILRSQNAIDFDDLLLFAYNLLVNHPKTAALYRRSFSAICIDEAQDLNNYRLRTFTSVADTFLLDSLSIIPGSFHLFAENNPVQNSLYSLNHESAKLQIDSSLVGIKLKADYRVFPINFSEKLFHKDYSKLSKSEDLKENGYYYSYQSQASTNYFGNDLIDFVYDKLKTVRDSIASELASLDLDEYELQQIHLLLSRQFVNSLVIHYNYAQQEGKDARTAKS